ncbi:MAG: GTP cyclohydrolase I [Acidobacteriota bacterium]|nr:GTP cyclohydrolase I [Acidobacteriota bacterium]MDH3783961.1 GTP cyclohydrolase I [Acidobacteriota bacterium]
MDLKKMEEGIRMFLDGIGGGFEADDRERTPERVARAWRDDLVSGYDLDPGEELTWTPCAADEGLVLVRDVRFASICVHHLLPFFGTADVAYLPGRRLAGLSKIGRVLDAHSRRLQTQEHLTRGVVDTLVEVLEPRGVLVVLHAEHTCMSLRGVRKEGSRMTTMRGAGLLAEGARRDEALALIAGHRG